MNYHKFDFNYFINIYVLTSFVLAGLSIIQYFGAPLGIFGFDAAGILRDSQVGNFISVGGIYDPIGEIGISGSVQRNQGWFSEPTNFAQFLMVPMFISLYKLLKQFSWFKILCFSSILLAFILTFSVANYFGVLVTVPMYFLLSIKNQEKKKYYLISVLISFSAFCILIYGLWLFSNFTNQDSDVSVLSKSTMRGFGYKMERNKVYFNRISEYPFGDINFKHVYTRSTGLIGHIALAGGYPLLLFMLIFFIYFFRIIYKHMIRSKYLLIYIALFAYFIPALWDAKFYEHYFLFLLVFFPTFLKNDQMGHIII